MMPYMGFLLQPLTELLAESSQKITDYDLWLAVIHTLTKSFEYDEGGKAILARCF